MIKSLVHDGLGKGISAEVNNNDGTETNALVVATRPLKTFYKKIAFFSNETQGIQMAVDGSSGFGVVEYIHDGTDNVYWTAVATKGTGWVFDSTDQNHTVSGTKSIKTHDAVNKDKFEIRKGSTMSVSGYVAFTGWIYLSDVMDLANGAELKFEAQNGSGNKVGDTVKVQNYINTNLTGVWQKFSISLADIALTTQTIDRVEFEVKGDTTGDVPNLYIDDVQLEEPGVGALGPTEYIVVPERESWLHIQALNITMVDALSTTLTDGTMPNLSYNKFLGVTELTSGLHYRRFELNEIKDSLIFRNLRDMLQLGGTTVTDSFCDGTNTIIKIRIPFLEPLIVKDDDLGYLSFVVQDDLSGLIDLKISCEAIKEKRDVIHRKE
jgi:hypothetical protein